MKTIKTMKKMLAVILVPLLLLTGCSILNKLADNFKGSKNTGGEAGNTTGLGNNPGNGAEDLEVVIVDTLPELMEFPSKRIGNATFKVETSKRATVKYPADGKAQSISVTDASGIEWMLEIPENALIEEGTSICSVTNN